MRREWINYLDMIWGHICVIQAQSNLYIISCTKIHVIQQKFSFKCNEKTFNRQKITVNR